MSTVPLKDQVVHILKPCRLARGPVKLHEPFFRNREGGLLSRNSVHERLRRQGRRA